MAVLKSVGCSVAIFKAGHSDFLSVKKRIIIAILTYANRLGRHEGHAVGAGLGVAIEVRENADVGVEGGGDEVDGEAGDADQAPGH